MRRRSIRRDTRGGVWSMTAIFLPVVVALSALVVDLGSLQVAKTGIESAAISASEAALERLPDTAAAQAFAIKVAEDQIVHIPRITDTAVSVETVSGRVAVTISARSDATFSRILGSDYFTVSRRWEAAP